MQTLRKYSGKTKRIGMPFLVLAVLLGVVAMPMNTVLAATVATPQATNNAGNVYYSVTYSGSGLSYFRVYIDTDVNTATGFNAYGIGANYLVENGTLYSHPANDSSWSWTSLGAVTYANTGSVASWTIARSAIGETATPNTARIVAQIEAPITTSGIYTHTYSGSGATATRTNTPAPGGGVIFYQDINYGGASSGVIAPGDYAVMPGSVPNDWMSSLRVPAGWIVDTYANANLSGAVCTFTADTSWVGTACNDVMSSFRIRSSGPTPTRTNTPVGPTPTRTNTPGSGGSTVVNYSASSAVITNPERGFDHSNTSCDSQMFSVSTLQSYRNSENISVVLCNFYLEGYQTTATLPASVLNTVQTQLNTIRSGGVKVILRFSYSKSSGSDANRTTAVGHINQLASIIQSNSDVIYLWQGGFIGQWGEGYYTTNYGNAGVITAQNWADRKAVYDAQLAALPSTRMISLRTPLMMTTMYGSTTVNSSTAYNGSTISRIGQHNDGFLASADDWGTYSDVATQYPWLQAQSTYTVMGGESEYGDSTRVQCPTALSEMAMFHWSYVNTDYNPSSIAAWQSGGCIPTMKQKLGYRFVLTTGTYPNTVAVGGGLNLQLSIRNDGYAAPFNPRNRQLILRNTSNGTVYRFALTSDPRKWMPGTTTNINQTITLSGVPAGSYALLLNLPDPVSGLSTRPEYSIQTANTGTWESSTGFNNLLKTVTVQ